MAKKAESAEATQCATPESLEEKIKKAAADCGLSSEEANAALSNPQAIGDGVLLGKILDFLKAIWPILAPIIGFPGATIQEK